ncbi:initiation factor 2 [Coprinopsis marcescibilis]|uniref:Translation initiation factor IF-2, mitochondrial n=1 Tax=Coprinopsis marcescibilis TaxID=230819 RepID=A0A5C3LCX0_COPMA|nr:initiation factor 2 [Coprinopsis marcescibilis]
MHRHGALAIRPRRALVQVRNAGTAAKLKPREWDQNDPGPSQSASSSTPNLSAAEKAALFRQRLAKSNGPQARPPPSQRYQTDRGFDSSFAGRDPYRKPETGFPRSQPSSGVKDSRGPASGYQKPQTSLGSREWRKPEPSSQAMPSRHQGDFDTKPKMAQSWDSRTPSRPQFRQNTPGPSELASSRKGPALTAAPGASQRGDVASDRDWPAQAREDMEIVPEEDSTGPLKARPMRNKMDAKFKSRGSLLEPQTTTQRQRSSKQFRPMDQTKQTKPTKPKLNARAQKRRLEVYIPSVVSVSNLARILKIKLPRLQRKMEDVGITDQATHDYVLTADYASLLAEEFGRAPIVDDEAAFDLYPLEKPADTSTLPHRPPIVTIMGHVDHGKTTLLDTLRSASVAKGEAGGITQHIGAFSVPVTTDPDSPDGSKSITFLDTPGHAAFSAMRARGAGVTDIIVLVVAADDGLMPQTREVIELFKKHEDSVGLVVAINKVDKPSANPASARFPLTHVQESVEKDLMAAGIQLESYGGDIPSVRVSGMTGEGLPELVETIAVIAEMQDIRAEQEGFAFGEVLESKVQQGLGMVGTVLVTKGSLKVGSYILSGQSYAKVRKMTDSAGRDVEVAIPGMAVTVCGWKSLPSAGDNVIEASEADVKKALNNRIRKADLEGTLANVDAINESRRHDREQRLTEDKYLKRNQHFEEISTDSGKKELRLVIKADVSGSAEAVEGALQGIGNSIATSRIISTGVGDVSESDVMLAKAANAYIVAFSVGVPRPVQSIANQNGVSVLSSDIIYKLMDDVRDRVRDLLPMIIETKVTGEAKVAQLFDISMKDKTQKKVAGCKVTNGLMEKSKFARVVRDGATIHDGVLDTLRQLKKDVTEVRKGTECGLSFDCFSDIREGDAIQVYERIEKRPAL